MKSIKQIRELEVQLAENVESSGDVRKLTALVRAGLFDSNKLTMLKRALNKENVKMTRVEREALLELLDRLLTVVLANQGTFQKVKQSIQEELSPEHDGEFSMARSDLKTAISSAQRILDKLNGEGKLEAWLQSKITLASDYLSSAANYVDSGEAELKEEYEEYDIENLDEATRTDVDINQIPPIIIMKRRAIRVFPDGQKVALYWADRINKYISVPFQSIGISEAVSTNNKKSDDDAIEKGSTARYLNRKTRQSASELLRQTRTPVKAGVRAGAKVSGSKTQKVGYGIGYALGSAIKGAMLKKKMKPKISATLSSPKVKALRKKAQLSLNPARAGEVKQLKKVDVALSTGAGHAESFRHKLTMIREQREINEFAPLVAAAARLAPALARAGGAILRSGAAKRLGGALLRGGKKAAGWGKKLARKALRAAKYAATAAAAGGAANGDGGGGDGGTNYKVDRPDSQAFKGKELHGTNPYAAARQRAADISFSRQQQENYKMIKSIAEGTEIKELKFADGAVELSPSVAGKIVETYNALNSSNKKIVLEMINKDKNSFMKFANFASSK